MWYTNAFIFQAVQCCLDIWRNVIGHTGITSLLAYFDSQDCLRDSDGEHQAFTKHYLDGCAFLYKDSDNEDKKVCKLGMICTCHIWYALQKWKGLFCGPLVVQTFAAHLSVTEGALNIPGLHNPDKAWHAAIGGIGLACASVTVLICHWIVLMIIRWKGH